MHRKGKDGISEMFTLVQLSIFVFFDYLSNRLFLFRNLEAYFYFIHSTGDIIFILFYFLAG